MEQSDYIEEFKAQLESHDKVRFDLLDEDGNALELEIEDVHFNGTEIVVGFVHDR